MSFDGKCPGTDAVADALGAVAPPVTRLAVDLVFVVAMRPDLQLFMAIVAVEASFVEDFVRGGTFLRRVNCLLASHAFFPAAESERFSGGGAFGSGYVGLGARISGALISGRTCRIRGEHAGADAESVSDGAVRFRVARLTIRLILMFGDVGRVEGLLAIGAFEAGFVPLLVESDLLLGKIDGLIASGTSRGAAEVRRWLRSASGNSGDRVPFGV